MPKKVLIVRFSSIGDIVLTTPVIRCLKQQTGAEIHFLTKAPFAGILEANPYVDKVIVIKKDLKEVARSLVQSKYDGCIDLHGNLRTLELKCRILLPFPLTRHMRPRPLITTFDKLNFEKFLLTKLKINRMPEVHIVQRYLAAAAPFGVVDDGLGLDYFIPEKDRVDLEEAGIPTKYLAFVIGAAHATKRLTETQMRAFCAALDHPIVLLGGPAEKEIGARIAHDLPHVTNACGTFNLAGSADVVRQATAVITHDTGLMHIAAAFRKPIVSVWGNTVPALGMYPYLPGQEKVEKERRQEVLDLPCRPCSKIGFAECPRGHFRCIKDQSASELASICASILSE
ncbi:glycosyltransferase family 9 protein [Neolewinella antarctica]|uniref:ADP-heptose:LPS heptosyltransferase n=1 Tax=Neolewinella antarctica TaxID=442734 RepID=A0ABX0XA08_9BACT|nr:glycosyltransferase family 9 protein [Neolewinella antarctica]NJC25789.1 ADP-heptose:LPS heptosyltransferase [Neolewinella antarctica]